MFIGETLSFGKYSFYARAGNRVIISTRLSKPEFPIGYSYNLKTLKIRPSKLMYDKGTLSLEVDGWHNTEEINNAK